MDPDEALRGEDKVTTLDEGVTAMAEAMAAETVRRRAEITDAPQGEIPGEITMPRPVPVVVYQEPDTLASVSESSTSEVAEMPTVATPAKRTRKPRPVKPTQTTRQCAYCLHESIDVTLSERATEEAGREIYFCRNVKECNARAEAQGITYHLED